MSKHDAIHASVLGLTLVVLAATGPAFAEERPEPRNQTVILLDGSKTYRSRIGEAIGKSQVLLEGIARPRLHRNEVNLDTITVIALDASPSVIWTGTMKDLKATDSTTWVDRFKSRTDYAQCTDVTAGFRLAAKALNGDPSFTDRYLFVFSDLIDEPPSGSRIRKCKKPLHPSPPPQGFPWNALAGVKVAALWLPPDQTLAWKRAVEEKGMEDAFTVNSDSESAAVVLAAPPRAVEKVSEAEVQQQQEQIKQQAVGFLKTAGIVVGALAFILLTLVLGGMALRRFRKGHRTRAVPAGGRLPPPAPPRPGIPLRQMPVPARMNRTPMAGSEGSRFPN